MKSIVLYALTKGYPKPEQFRDYSAVRIGCCNRVYVRAEEHKVDFETALDRAKPRKGEAVLNSINLDGDYPLATRNKVT